MTLTDAVRANDVERVSDLVGKSKRGALRSALGLASSDGMVGVIAPLAAALPRGYISDGLVPAIRGGHADCVSALRRAGASMPGRLGGRSATSEVAATGSVSLLNALRTAYSSRTGEPYQQSMPWRHEHVGAMPAEDRGLPAAGDGYHPLINAIRGGHEEMVEALLTDGAEPNVATLAGRNPVELAAALGHAAIAGLLADHGGVPLDRSSLNLAACAGYGFADEVESRWEASSDQERATALTMAAQGGRLSLVHRIAPHVDRGEFQSALYFAAGRGNSEAARALIGLGAEVNKKTRFGLPLAAAAAQGHTETCAVLLRSGAKPDTASSGDRVPPLHDALRGGHLEIVQLLLAAGASPNKVEADGTTTMACAQASEVASEAVPLIEAAGGRYDIQKVLLKELKSLLRKSKRRAFLPVTAFGDAEVRASKFGGHPFLPASHPRPAGAAPLPLALQLDLSAHPDAKLATSGLLQVFYDRSGYGEARLRVRVVSTEDPHVPDGGPSFPERPIQGWSRAKSDFPSVGGDPASNHEPLSPDQQAVLRRLNVAGDKVGGWPDWLQDPEYSCCPQCGAAQSELVVQLEGGRQVPIDLGDAAIGYVFRCTDHKNELAVAVQSY